MAEETEKAAETEKYFDDQRDDEEVLFIFRKHPIVMRKGLILAMVALLLGTVPALIKPDFNYFFGGLAAGFIFGLIIMFPAWLSWYYSIFIVTDQRLIQITQKGLFNRSVVDLSLSQIMMVNYEIAGLQQTLLGFGTIMMQTYVGDLVIHEVHHPAKIQKKLLEILRGKGGMDSSPPMVKGQGSEEEN